MHKGWVTLIGFILLLIGIISMVLYLVGLRLSFLASLQDANPLLHLGLNILFILFGIIIMFLSKTSAEEYSEK